tara:strand:+ start:1230 stop:2180 length:951 start_codon:yes stop_codon:yes gene_type:complete
MKMNILFYVETSNKLNVKNSGGIESLNKDLYKSIKKINKKTFISNKFTKKLGNKKWDIVVSSNNAKIFDNLHSKRKILWFHNKLQIEKAIRKSQLFPIIKNKINAVFNSKYLKNKTSKLYNFNQKIVIPNFLVEDFQNLKINYNRKPYFVWSVQRPKGLINVIELWINKINSKNNKVKLFIFGLQESKLEKYNLKKLSKFNIYFMGRVNKSTLIKYYTKSMGMICLGYDETFCLNVIEAYSCGLPIISFGLTAVGEMTNKNNSFLISGFKDLDSTIFKILNLHKKKRRNMTNYCINYSKRYYLQNIFPTWTRTLGL